jgi:hypothetical protein
MAVALTNAVFCVVITCSLEKRFFGGTRRLRFQGRKLSHAKTRKQKARFFWFLGFSLGSPEDGNDMFLRKFVPLPGTYSVLTQKNHNLLLFLFSIN